LITQTNIGWGVQIIKHICMQFFPLPCYFVPIRPKYSQTPSAYVLPWTWVTKFHAHTKQRAKLEFWISYYLYVLIIPRIYACQ
jgi:hypothetical protein